MTRLPENQEEEGVLLALLKGFENHRLPRTLHLKDKVDAGEVLTEDELEFLEDLLKDTENIVPMIDRHPQYQDTMTHVVHLYHHISAKALENEKATTGL